MRTFSGIAITISVSVKPGATQFTVMPLETLPSHSLAVLIIGHVGLGKHGLASHLADVVHDVRSQVPVREIVDSDIRAFRGQGECDGAADAARGSGDESSSSGELHRDPP